MIDIESNDYSIITFESECVENGVRKNVRFVVDNETYYPEIMQQFVYFLQSIGFTYVAGMTAINDEGRELHTTEI